MPARKRAKHRTSWLSKELGQVKRYLRDGLTVGAIGKLLGRTEAAVRKKLFDEGISARRAKAAKAKRPAAKKRSTGRRAAAARR